MRNQPREQLDLQSALAVVSNLGELDLAKLRDCGSHEYPSLVALRDNARNLILETSLASLESGCDLVDRCLDLIEDAHSDNPWRETLRSRVKLVGSPVYDTPKLVKCDRTLFMGVRNAIRQWPILVKRETEKRNRESPEFVFFALCANSTAILNLRWDHDSGRADLDPLRSVLREPNEGEAVGFACGEALNAIRYDWWSRPRYQVVNKIDQLAVLLCP